MMGAKGEQVQVQVQQQQHSSSLERWGARGGKNSQARRRAQRRARGRSNAPHPTNEHFEHGAAVRSEQVDLIDDDESHLADDAPSPPRA